jgi:transketolase
LSARLPPAEGAALAALTEAAARLRLAVIECHRRAGAGHLGSSLSIVESLSVLFGRYFNERPPGSDAADGDRFVLSKGHAALALYCQLDLAGRLGPGRLEEFGRSGGALEPHPCERALPILHASSGSLGQGLSIGLGLALGSRLRGRSDRCFVVIGDGEVNEGQIWEAALSAPQLGLGNLIVILDRNGFQQDGPMAGILPLPDLSVSWGAMGWRCRQADGHDCAALAAAFDDLLDGPPETPRLLIAETVKGRGVPFLENTTESHYPPPLTAEDLALVRYLGAQEGRRHG